MIQLYYFHPPTESWFFR